MRIKYTDRNSNPDEDTQIIYRILKSISNKRKSEEDIDNSFRTTGKLDWETWANLPYNKKSKYYSEKTEYQTLIIKPSSLPSKNLTKHLHYVKVATIEMNPLCPPHELIDYLTKLITLERLTITRVTEPINFISGQHLKAIFVASSVESGKSPNDLVEPLLETTSQLHTFKYAWGHLNTNSITLLNNNPIQSLYLNDVTIENVDLFSNFLSTNPHLKIVKLIESRDAQKCLFLNSDETLQKVKILKITLHPQLMESIYANISKCSNLKRLHILFAGFEELLFIYRNIILLPKLEQIIIQPRLSLKGTEPSPVLRILEQHYFHTWQAIFKNRNVKLNRVQPIKLLREIDELKI